MKVKAIISDMQKTESNNCIFEKSMHASINHGRQSVGRVRACAGVGGGNEWGEVNEGQRSHM